LVVVLGFVEDRDVFISFAVHFEGGAASFGAGEENGLHKVKFKE
jgi:hypothetical protein